MSRYKRSTASGAYPFLKGQKTTHPLYSVYRGILKRCNYPNDVSYKHYGGRGIKCLWKSFEEFKDSMYESYLVHLKSHGKENTTIDRIDVNGNYCKENCRWATQKEQRNNQRFPRLRKNGRFTISV